MKATFIGTDNTLGYRQGQEYDLEITEQGSYVLVLAPQYVPYVSWKDFFDNWERVRSGH